jgi:NADH-quinone oxidoreductase subunit G
MSKHTLPATELISLEVDGKPVKVPANANLIQACEAAGVYVPHYCWHPSLSVPGNCRLCLLRVDNARVGPPGKLVAGCHTLVQPAMQIVTTDPQVHDSRSGMMEFLLANHPLDCPQCDRGGECQLQRYSMDYGIGESRFAPNERRRFPKPQFDKLIDIERNRCILCTRCTRFCDEVAGEHVMGVFGRGDQCYIGTFGDGPVSNVYSGNTIDICPVGCLTNKPYRFQARSWELKQTTSVCAGCSSGCAVTFWSRSGQVMRTTPPAAPSDQFGKFTLDVDTTEFICNQGRFGNDYGRHDDRVTRVVVHKKAPSAGVSLVASAEKSKATLDEAVKETAAKLKEAAAKGKAAIIASPRLTTEEYMAAAWLAKEALGTNNIDWRARLAHREAADALSEAMAIANGSLEFIHEYAAVLLVGSSAQQVTPIAALEIKEAARRGQTALFVAGSRVDKFFSIVAKGSFLIDAGREGDWLSWLASGDSAQPAYAESFGEATGAEKLASALSGEGKLLLAYDPTSMAGAFAGPLVAGAKALKAKLGDRLHTLPLFREANGVGAFLAGAQRDRKLAAADHDKKGLTAPEILEKAAAGEIDALLLLGAGDALDGHPRPALVAKALEKTAFVAATELLDGPIGRAATVVFPAANQQEKSGTLLNVEGRVGRLTKSEPTEGDVRSDFDHIRALCAALGKPLPWATPAEAFAAFREAAEKANAVHQARTTERDGKITLAAFNFSRRGEEAQQKPRTIVRLGEAANGFRPGARAEFAAGDGLALAWDDHLQGHDHFGSRSAQAEILTPPATVEISPADAARLGFANRDEAELDVAGAKASVRVVVSEGVRKGVAYVGRNVAGLTFGSGPKENPPRASLKKKSTPAKATK